MWGQIVKYLKWVVAISVGIGGVFAAINEFLKLYRNVEVTRLVEVVVILVVMGYIFVSTKTARPGRRWLGMASFGMFGVGLAFLTAWWLWGDNPYINNASVYPIEKVGVNSYAYGTGYLSETTRLVGQDFEHAFRMDYTLSDAEPKYAGFTLALANHFDTTPYRAIRFSIQISSEKCVVRLSMKSATDRGSNIGLEPFVRFQPTPQTVEVPLAAIDHLKVDMTSLRWIDFYSDNTEMKGQHYVIVSNVEFIK